MISDFFKDSRNINTIYEVLGPFWGVIFNDPKTIRAICKAHALSYDEIERNYKDMLTLFNEPKCPEYLIKNLNILFIPETNINRVQYKVSDEPLLNSEIFEVGQETPAEVYEVTLTQPLYSAPLIQNDLKGSVTLIDGIDYKRKNNTTLTMTKHPKDLGFIRRMTIINDVPTYEYIMFYPFSSSEENGYYTHYDFYGVTNFSGTGVFDLWTTEGTITNIVKNAQRFLGITAPNTDGAVIDNWKEGNFFIYRTADELIKVPAVYTPVVSIGSVIDHTQPIIEELFVSDDITTTDIPYYYVPADNLMPVNVHGIIIPNIEVPIFDSSIYYLLQEDGKVSVYEDDTPVSLENGNRLSVNFHLGGFKEDVNSFYQNLIANANSFNIDLNEYFKNYPPLYKPTRALFKDLTLKAPAVLGLTNSAVNSVRTQLKAFQAIPDSLPAGANLRANMEVTVNTTVTPTVEDSIVGFIVYTETENLNFKTTTKTKYCRAVI